jgi:hypothetical protein
MNPNDELGVLGYNSSAPDLIARDVVKPIDEEQVSTLERVLTLLDNRAAYYGTVDSISLEPDHLKVFTAEQQLAMNKKMVFHVQELKGMIQTTINKVKEKQADERGY